MRLWSWQAVAHGADAVLFFQMRASRGACEKYHGAVIGHAGRSDTRVFREVAALGAELDRLGGAALGARTPARVALLFDWDSWWALEISDGPSRLVRYQRRGARLPPGAVGRRGRRRRRPGDRRPVPLRRGASRRRCTCSRATSRSGWRRWPTRGGSVRDDVPVRPGRRERQRLPDGRARPARAADGRAGRRVGRPRTGRRQPGRGSTSAATLEVEARLLFELVIPQGAEVVGTYQADFYAGTPAVTRNAFGAGHGWYVGAGLDQAGVSLGRPAGAGPARPASGRYAGRARPRNRRPGRAGRHAAAVPAQPPRRRRSTVAAGAGGVDLLTGDRVLRGQPMTLKPRGVVVLREDR